MPHEAEVISSGSSPLLRGHVKKEKEKKRKENLWGYLKSVDN
jgi:hypothetical protein